MLKDIRYNKERIEGKITEMDALAQGFSLKDINMNNEAFERFCGAAVNEMMTTAHWQEGGEVKLDVHVAEDTSYALLVLQRININNVMPNTIGELLAGVLERVAAAQMEQEDQAAKKPSSKRFCMSSLDNCIDAACALPFTDGIDSMLYKMDGEYYLLLRGHCDCDTFVLSEYADGEDQGWEIPYLREHGTCLFHKQALEGLRSLGAV